MGTPGEERKQSSGEDQPHKQRGRQTPDQSGAGAGSAPCKKNAEHQAEQSADGQAVRDGRTQREALQHPSAEADDDAKSGINSLSPTHRIGFNLYRWPVILWQTCCVFSYRKSMVWTMSFGKNSSTVQSTNTRIFRSSPGNFPR